MDEKAATEWRVITPATTAELIRGSRSPTRRDQLERIGPGPAGWVLPMRQVDQRRG